MILPLPACWRFYLWPFILLLSGHAIAFDEDKSINIPSFVRENFLDIKSYEFRKSVDDRWAEIDNGWRVSAGSLGSNLLYTELEFKYRNYIDSYAEFRLRGVQKSVYAEKPTRYQVEIGVRPLDWIFLSIIGTPTYEKRNSDLGFAVELGKRPGDFFRVAHLQHDLFFNEKNEQDDSEYLTRPKETQVQIAKSFAEEFELNLTWTHDKDFSQRLARDQLGNIGLFEYGGDEAELMLDYHLSDASLIGISLEGFRIDKSREHRSQHQSQKLRYRSLDLYYWQLIKPDWEVTFGGRYDRFMNDLKDINFPNESFDQIFDTHQLYGTVLTPKNTYLSLEYGLYIGYVERKDDYLTNVKADLDEDSWQSKFRFSIELHSADKSTKLMLGTNWNLDDLPDDYWDGGHFSVQSEF